MSSNIIETRAHNLMRLRESRGLSLAEAAKRCSITRNTYTDIELGVTLHPREDTLLKIAKGFDVNLDTLNREPENQVIDKEQLLKAISTCRQCAQELETATNTLRAMLEKFA